jgi:hypothetical protein
MGLFWLGVLWFTLFKICFQQAYKTSWHILKTWPVRWQQNLLPEKQPGPMPTHSA